MELQTTIAKITRKRKISAKDIKSITIKELLAAVRFHNAYTRGEKVDAAYFVRMFRKAVDNLLPEVQRRLSIAKNISNILGK